MVVDPGEYSTDFVAPEHVVAVVITHQHADHFDREMLSQIFDKNDDVLVLGSTDVIDTIEVENKRAVAPNEKVTVGAFDLEFFGGVHALIHESMPRIQNVGVMINDLIYYPGDSFAVPTHAVDTLAIPAAAPWMKIGEAIDFLLAVRPRFVFPTHDAISSNAGKGLADKILGMTAEKVGATYERLTKPLEI